MATSQTAEYPWVFREENEWEGETWKVYFEVDAESDYKIQRLQELIVFHDHLDQFSFRQIEEIPRNFQQSHENSEEDYCECEDVDDDEYEDCDCEYDVEGYYPAEQFATIDVEVLDEALAYFENQEWNSQADNPLYKLRLFNL